MKKLFFLISISAVFMTTTGYAGNVEKDAAVIAFLNSNSVRDESQKICTTCNLKPVAVLLKASDASSSIYLVVSELSTGDTVSNVAALVTTTRHLVSPFEVTATASEPVVVDLLSLIEIKNQ